jgi:hypothetical protein
LPSSLWYKHGFSHKKLVISSPTEFELFFKKTISSEGVTNSWCDKRIEVRQRGINDGKRCYARQANY